MSVTYVIEFRVRPDQLDRFTRLLDGVLDRMREETTFRNAVLHRNPEDPLHLLLYETWADHADVLNVQMHRPYRAEWHNALPEILAAPRAIAIWQPIRADGATL